MPFVDRTFSRSGFPALHVLAQDQPALLGAVTIDGSPVLVLRGAVFDVTPLEINAPEAHHPDLAAAELLHTVPVWSGQTAPLIIQVPRQKNFCAPLRQQQPWASFRKATRKSVCGADWFGGRLACACCGNEDHRTQQCLYEEGQQDRMRVDACDACSGYVKVISAFSPTPVELLPIEDLATPSLDRTA